MPEKLHPHEHQWQYVDYTVDDPANGKAAVAYFVCPECEEVKKIEL